MELCHQCRRIVPTNSFYFADTHTKRFCSYACRAQYLEEYEQPKEMNGHATLRLPTERFASGFSPRRR